MHQVEKFGIFNPINITRAKRLSVQKWNIQALHKMGKFPSGTRQNMAALKFKVVQYFSEKKKKEVLLSLLSMKIN